MKMKRLIPTHNLLPAGDKAARRHGAKIRYYSKRAYQQHTNVMIAPVILGATSLKPYRENSCCDNVTAICQCKGLQFEGYQRKRGLLKGYIQCTSKQNSYFEYRSSAPLWALALLLVLTVGIYLYLLLS